MAFETLFYVNSVTGNDTTGDGITIPVATNARASAIIKADPARVNKYTLIIETSSFNDPVIFDFGDVNASQPWIKIIFANGAKLTGTGQCGIRNDSGSNGGALWVIGAQISGYEYAISDAPLTNFTTQFKQPRTILEDCDLEGYIYLPRMLSAKLNSCHIRTGIAHSTNGDLSTWCLTNTRNCDFRGANQFKNTGTITVPIWTVEEWRFQSNTAEVAYEGWQAICAHNDFDSVGNITIALRVGQTYGASATAQQYYFMSNNFNGCNVNFTTNILTIPVTWAAAADAATMRAKAATDGLTLASNWFEYELFSAISYDSFDFPINEVSSQILNHHIGVNRYSSEAPVISPPTGWAIISDTYYTISDTPDPLVVVVSIPQARKARRVVIEFDRANDIEQFGTDGRIAVKIKESHDGGLTFPFAEFTRYVGIQASTLDFDYIDSSATDWKLTIESQDIAGGAGGVLFRWIGIEFYDMDEQITAGARTLYEQKATDPNGYFVVGLPYEVVTGTGDFTAQEIKDNVSAIKVYADVEETNISSFELDGEIYNTFVPDVVQIASVRAIRAGLNGSKLELKDVPCSNYDSKMLKFKNGAGVWEYLLFYAKDEEKPNRSSEQYLQFEDGYKNVNGDIQRDYRIFNDQFGILNKPVLDYLDKNQNVWYANGWHFSSFKMILMPSTISNFPLLTNERFVKTDLTQSQYNELFKRFKTGDRITFATDSSIVDMYGFVAQMSEVSGVYTVYFKFTGATGNDDLATLDAYLGVTDLYVVAYDAWELCTIDNATVTTTSRSVLNVSLTLKTNPETNYRV